MTKRSIKKLFFLLPVAVATATAAAQPPMFIHEELFIAGDNFFWDQMDSTQRAALWPILTQEQQLARWRFMDKTERHALRESLRPYGGFKFRTHLIGLTAPSQVSTPRQMTVEELSMLRRQVHRVSVELRSGVPFECTDPRNCPSILVRYGESH